MVWWEGGSFQLCGLKNSKIVCSYSYRVLHSIRLPLFWRYSQFNWHVRNFTVVWGSIFRIFHKESLARIRCSSLASRQNALGVSRYFWRIFNLARTWFYPLILCNRIQDLLKTLYENLLSSLSLRYRWLFIYMTILTVHSLSYSGSIISKIITIQTTIKDRSELKINRWKETE